MLLTLHNNFSEKNNIDLLNGFLKRYSIYLSLNLIRVLTSKTTPLKEDLINFFINKESSYYKYGMSYGAFNTKKITEQNLAVISFKAKILLLVKTINKELENVNKIT
jgi:hypothetical protein